MFIIQLKTHVLLSMHIDYTCCTRKTKHDINKKH